MEEAEALGQLGRDQVAQRHVVDQHDEADAVARCLRLCAHRHVVGDDRYLALQVDAPGRISHLDRVAGAKKGVRSALIH